MKRWVTLVGLSLVAAGAVTHGTGAGADTATDLAHVERVNEMRAIAGLPPARLDPQLAADARAAARWAAESGELTDDLRGRGASAEATRGAAESVLFGSTHASAPLPADAIDALVNSLGHGMWLLHPQLTRTGAGTASSTAARGWRWVAAIDVVGGVDASAVAPAGPFVFPRSGTRYFDVLRGPQTDGPCAGSRGPTLRVIGGTTARYDTAPATDVSVRVAGRPVSVCVADFRTYPLLGYLDSVAIIPDEPLRGASDVTVEVLHRGRRLVSTFSTAFSDTRGSVHEPAIEAARDAGIVGGFADGSYRPRGNVTRGQMASMLQRALELPPRSGSSFSDTAGSVHAAAIEAVHAAGIVGGFADGTFRPNTPVNRGQAASMLQRALDLPPTSERTFPDVATSGHAEAIEAARAAGVVTGFSDGTYRPVEPVARGQLASMLVRALDIPVGG